MWHVKYAICEKFPADGAINPIIFWDHMYIARQLPFSDVAPIDAMSQLPLFTGSFDRLSKNLPMCAFPFSVV